MFFRILQRVHADREPHRLREVLRFERLASPDGSQRVRERIAISRAPSDALPASEQNRARIESVLEGLPAGSEAVPLDGLESLAQQAEALASCTAFVGPFGDLAILAAASGCAVRAFHSEGIPAEQETLVRTISEEGVWGSIALQPIERAEEFRPAAVPRV
jgi:hypothetical protein